MNNDLDLFLDDNIEHFKILVLGDIGVGKTSTIKKFVKNTVNITHTMPTIGMDIFTKNINIFYHKIKYTFYDIAGDIKENKLLAGTINKKNIDFILIFFDICDNNSFKNMEKIWINVIKNNLIDYQYIYIIGNKKDVLCDHKLVKEIDVTNLLLKYGYDGYYNLITKPFYSIMIELTKKYSKKELLPNKINNSSNDICNIF